MVPETFRKVKATITIVMLSVAEGHRIQASSRHRSTSHSDGVARVMADPPSQEQVMLSATQVTAIIADPQILSSESNALREWPNIPGQAKVVVEQMDAMKADPLVLVEINEMSRQRNAKTNLLPMKVSAPPLGFEFGHPRRAPTLPVGGTKLVSGHFTTGTDDKAAHPLNQGAHHAGTEANTHSSALTSAKGQKMLMPTLVKALSPRNPRPVMSGTDGKKRFPIDAPLLLFFCSLVP